MIRRFKFRGYDKPVVEGRENSVFYGDGVFTVGEVYETDTIDMYDASNIYMPVTDVKGFWGGGMFPDALFMDDVDRRVWEELIYFDEV